MTLGEEVRTGLNTNPCGINGEEFCTGLNIDPCEVSQYFEKVYPGQHNAHYFRGGLNANHFGILDGTSERSWAINFAKVEIQTLTTCMADRGTD